MNYHNSKSKYNVFIFAFSYDKILQKVIRCIYNTGLTKLDGTCLKKDSLITYDVLTSDLKSLVSRSVGMIRLGDHAKGTGFRVGENLIITNLHVVQPDLIGKT